MRKMGNCCDCGVKIIIVWWQIKKNYVGYYGGVWKVVFVDFILVMMVLFMMLWIVNSVSKFECESIIVVLYGQLIFSGGGLLLLNKISLFYLLKFVIVVVLEEMEKKV